MIFSANLHATPVDYKGITFYPFPNKVFLERFSLGLSSSLLRHRTIVMREHPSLLVNQGEWDSIYFLSNPIRLTSPLARSHEVTSELLSRLNLLLKRIKNAQKMNLIQITPNLEKSNRKLTPEKESVNKCFYSALEWPTRKFGYRPRFLYDHFEKFFEINQNQ